MPAQKRPPGRRFRLRLYERLFEMIRWPTFLLAISTYVLWYIALDYPLLAAGRDLLLIIVVISWLLFIASLIAPVLCFVQCHANYVLISTPVYRLSVSYGRISTVQPVNFGSKYSFYKQRWSQRRFLEPLFREQATGQLTVVGVLINKYPQPLLWLKLWFNQYMFAPDAPGFLFMVRDWMALSHQLEDYREDWRTRRTSRRRSGVSAASRVLSKGDRRR